MVTPKRSRTLRRSIDAPRILTLIGQKGGVGKSTIAISMAVEATERGLQVLLVDADPGSKSARVWEAVAIKTGRRVPKVIAMGASMVDPGQLDVVGGSYDLVVIDCPPHDEITQRAALMLSDFALLPCGPSIVDGWAFAQSVELVTAARKVRHALRAAIVVNRKKQRTVIGNSARAELAELGQGIPVLTTELVDRTAYQEAFGFGLGATTYARGDEAAREFRALYDEVFGG